MENKEVIEILVGVIIILTAILIIQFLWLYPLASEREVEKELDECEEWAEGIEDIARQTREIDSVAEKK
jgi:hypothetical protein